MLEMLDTTSAFHPFAFYSVDLSIAFLIRQLKQFFFSIGIRGVLPLNDQGGGGGGFGHWDFGWETGCLFPSLAAGHHPRGSGLLCDGLN